MAYDYTKFSFTNESYSICKRTETYSCTKSGKWRKNPDSVAMEKVSAEHYTNYVTAVPFFNNFGHGAYCRAHWNYCIAGYLPTEIVTVSPGRDTKVVTYFNFYIVKERRI